MSGYRLVESREIGRGGFLTFAEETFESPVGQRFVRWMVEHPGAVAAVPVEDGPDGPVVILVRQWRPFGLATTTDGNRTEFRAFRAR